MTSKYRRIQGVTYDRDLLQLAEASSEGGLTLRKPAAQKLWEKANADGRLTDTEARTIRHIVSTHKLDKPAKDFLEARLSEHAGEPPSTGRRKSSQYYTYVDGVRCDRTLLEEANQYAEQGAITLEAAENLWASAHDGRGVTETERRTLRVVLETYTLTAEAQAFLRRHVQPRPSLQSGVPPLPAPVPEAATERPVLSEAAKEPLAKAAKFREPHLPDMREEEGTTNSTFFGRLLVSPLAAVKDFFVGVKRKVDDGAASEANKRMAIEDGTSSAGRVPSRVQQEQSPRESTQQQQQQPQQQQPPRPSHQEPPQQPQQQQRQMPQQQQQQTQRRQQQQQQQQQSQQQSQQQREPQRQEPQQPRQQPGLASGSPASSGGADLGNANTPLLERLSPELQRALSDGCGAGSPLALELPQATQPEESALEKQRAAALAEVERILAARRVEEILGGGAKEEQQREFKRIALLLHPDKGLVSRDDAQASLALQLALVALQKARRTG